MLPVERLGGDGKCCFRAANAIKANPQKSNRVIADEIGADEKTVRKARADWSAPASDDAPERVGRGQVNRRYPMAYPTGGPPKAKNSRRHRFYRPPCSFAPPQISFSEY